MAHRCVHLRWRARLRLQVCKTTLKDKKCVQYQGGLYCSGCYHDVHSPPCGRCGERVRGEFVEVRGVRYKKECFNCYECGIAFTREEKKGAYPIGGRLLCYTHALETRRRELKEAKEAKEKEAESAAAAAEAAPPPAEEPEQESKLSAPAVTVSKDAAPAEEGGAMIMPQKSVREIVRSGTKRVSRMKRKPSTKPPSKAQTAAVQAAITEAENDSSCDREDSEMGDELEVAEGAKVADIPEDPAAEARSPSVVVEEAEEEEKDPFAEMWAGFIIPMKLSKFVLSRPGRTALDIAPFTLIQKKIKAQVLLVLCTDVAMLVQKVEDGCYELMFMPVERSKVKAKIVSSPPNCMQVKMGKKVVLKAKTDVLRSGWIGKLNAPIGFVPTKDLENQPDAEGKDAALLF